jgi:hypothetical protein
VRRSEQLFVRRKGKYFPKMVRRKGKSLCAVKGKKSKKKISEKK